MNKSLDFAHKIFSPATYNCDLCKLTHGNIGPKKEWENFIKELNIDVLFLYKDDTKSEYSLPVVLLRNEALENIIVSAKEMRELTELNDLISLIRNKLNL